MDINFIKYIDNAMNIVAEENKNDLSTALITKIPNSNCYYNSINIAVGRQRSGKTYSIIKEIIRISHTCLNTHLLVYVNKTGGETDKTFENFKKLITTPIVYVSHENLEEFLKTLFKWKSLYNEVFTEKLEEKIVDSQRDQLFEHLHIKDFKSSFLHTLILLDDVSQTKMLKKDGTFIQEMLTQCAHINCSFFLAIHYWNALSPKLKTQASTVIVFGGYSKQQLRYIFSQTNTEVNINELWNEYRHFNQHERMLVDTRNNEVIFNPL